MKAAFVTAYGGSDVIKLKEVDRPSPGKGEVLVGIHSTAVTAGDARLRGLDVPFGFKTMVRLMFGWSRPRRPIMGWCFAGRVEALGPETEGPEIGTAVMGIAGPKGGAHAEYIALPAARVVPMPTGLSMDEGAAFFFGGLTAQYFLMEQAGLQKGERVLINGATGSVGSAAIEMAKAVGAHVTAVCGAANAALAKELGADAVLDYRHDVIDGRYDVVMDVIGTLQHQGALPLLEKGGRLILVTAGLMDMLGAAVLKRKDGILRIGGTSPEDRNSIENLVRRYEAGEYRPRVGMVLPFADIRAAHEIASGRHKPGNLVLRMKD
ncbi:NAD(P)-dependent alcohol dehydrogenase [Thioclava sp. FR2]|uniref:NAD(P)-dependent alcohol dehydrogenase n=1 Tax=Thioclava sp. FR2 TaxID=3445780 RepID=UPI003EBCA38F